MEYELPFTCSSCGEKRTISQHHSVYECVQNMKRKERMEQPKKVFDVQAIEPTPFLNNEQPAPKEGRIPVYHRALADIQERVRGGRIKYGTELKTGNGRDPLVDALQEAIDLVLYLEQALLEREGY